MTAEPHGPEVVVPGPARHRRTPLVSVDAGPTRLSYAPPPDRTLQSVRSLVPAAALPALVRRRVESLWTDPAFRAAQEAEMEFLVGQTERAAEVPDLARAYAEQAMLRTWMRWHARAITRQPVRDAGWLTERRDRSRPLVLSFLHHHRYDGLFGSLARHGADLHILTLADALSPEAPTQIKQHVRVVSRGGEMVSTVGGTTAILERMRPGVTMAIASDVPGQTPVTFLGRQVLGSAGAARIAIATNSPVVVVTSHRDPGGRNHLQVHEPLEPSAFDGWEDLLAAILRLHEPAVLAWPEALDTPLARFGQLG